MVKYSFVLPAYKANFLAEAIRSILAQTYCDFELIIVDDCSPDNIKSIVDSFDDDRIRYYRNEENIGGKDLVAQWNHSISYALGEWIILATDDDLYDYTFLETAESLLNKYPNSDIFRGRTCAFHQDDIIDFIEPALPEFTGLEEFYYSMNHVLYGGIPQYVFRKTKLDSIGGFFNLPMAWGSDDITSIIMAKNGIVCSWNILVRFRNSGMNISTEGKYEEQKLIARFMKFAYLYSNILPCLKDDDLYNKYFVTCIQNDYSYKIKQYLLEYYFKFPFHIRRKLLYLIEDYTPFLDLRNKKTMKFRALYKIQKKLIRLIHGFF